MGIGRGVENIIDIAEVISELAQTFAMLRYVRTTESA